MHEGKTEEEKKLKTGEKAKHERKTVWEEKDGSKGWREEKKGRHGEKEANLRGKLHERKE